MTQSFKQQNTDDVALILARRQVGLRHGLSNPMDKMAFDLSSSLSSVGDWWKNQDPAAQKAMMGAGVGGTLGLGSGLFRRGKKHPFRDFLTGAVAGGTLGGGIGLLGRHKDIAEIAFPSTADEPDLAKNITKLQDLSEKAQPSLLHQAGGAMANHPILSALGIGGAADVGTGMTLAAQGKNLSPGAWENVVKSYGKQLTELGGNTEHVTKIERLLQGLEGQRAGPRGGAATSRPIVNEVMELLRTGNTKGLSNLEEAPEIMRRLRNVEGVYRPMTGTQYAMQQGARNPGTRFGRAQAWLSRGARNPLKKLPKSLPNIPKSKGALIGIPAALIAAWLASKSALNVNSARDQINEMSKQIQR